MRELITNALMHADYSIIGSTIMVAVFSDRLEISNPGWIQFCMTLEDALTGSSRLRNRVIARIFRELKLTEHWGSGMQRVVEACAKAGLQAPLFQDLGTAFKVTLYAAAVRERKLNKAQEQLVTHIKHKKIRLVRKKQLLF